MERDDADARPKPAHEIGQDLAAISVDELEERAKLLEAEIERLRAEMRRKQVSRAAAGAFFKL